jgi:hypothetical protein
MPAVFLHYATNLYGDYLLETQIFQQPLAMNFTEIKTIIYWAIALFLIWRTRGLLGYDNKMAAENDDRRIVAPSYE